MLTGKELDGILVVSLEQAVAAPYAGLLLADTGARVIKVERPDGDFARGYDTGAGGQSAIFAWLNRGKESIALDLKSEDDFAMMQALLAQADIFLSNLAPGAVARLGLSGDVLRKRNPGLITCRLTGYGESEAAMTQKAYDFLIQGETGVCSVTGGPDAPARVGVSLTDLSTGQAAFSALLRALLQRAKTGLGVDVHLSMFDVVSDWMNMPLLAHRYSGGAPQRSGLQHSFVAPYGAFACRGGEQVLLSIQNNREWAAFCASVLERPALISDPKYRNNPDRYANRDALAQTINDVFGRMTRDAVLSKLNTARIANARLNDVADLSNHSFLTNAEAIIADTPVEMAALPVRTETGTPTRVPNLDEHGAALREEFLQSGKRPDTSV